HDGQDAEIVAALQALRRTLSPLHVPAAPMPVFADHLKKEYEMFNKQNPQQIADISAAPEILDRAIAFVSQFSGTDFQSRRFLGGLICYVRAYHPYIAVYLTKQREPGHIILPGQQFMPPPVAEPHTHGPGCHHHWRERLPITVGLTLCPEKKNERSEKHAEWSYAAPWDFLPGRWKATPRLRTSRRPAAGQNLRLIWRKGSTFRSPFSFPISHPLCQSTGHTI